MGYLALCFCAVFIIWLLRQDVVLRGRMSQALWIQLIWLLIYSSRPVGRWLGIGVDGREDTDGSPLDAFIQFGLIASAFFVLNRRRFRWVQLPILNIALSVLFLYFAISIVWTPYPFIAFKRIFKEFGHLLVVLVVLTEANPAEAFKTICVRCATVLFPVSFVLIRWFPAYGRAYGNSGGMMVTGVTTQKNTLGQICCFYSLILLWDMVDRHRECTYDRPWKALGPGLIVFAMGLWLLLDSGSKTSLLAFLIGLAIFFITAIKLVRRSAPFVAKCIFLSLSIGLVISAVRTSQIAPLLEALGRNDTFTERTKIWENVLKQDINPFIGCGFFSFWLDKGPFVWEEFQNFKMNTAHSGYLEMYLDGGFIGSALLGVFLIFTSWRTANLFSHTNSFSRAIFAMVMMALIINFSETCFFRLCLLWFSLVLSSLACHSSIFPNSAASEESEHGQVSEPMTVAEL